MHILLIDDEVNVVDNLTLYLKRSGHTCATLRRITDKVHLHTRLEEIQPDGAILDFGMLPSGDDVYRWIKEWRNGVTRIVFYTNYAESAIQHHKMRLVSGSDNAIVEKREVGSDVIKILAAFS